MPEVKEVQSPIEPKGDEKIEITAKDLYANYGASGTGIFS
jgi:hypothetical protein